MLCGLIVLAALNNPSERSSFLLSHICPSSSPPTLLRFTQISLGFLLGATMVISMTFLRIWCYRTLGNLFTFEITIHKSHRLIRTGPYAYVCHPSYTALSFVIIGFLILTFAPGSWITECQIMRTPVAWLPATFTVLSLFSVLSVWRRGKIEDEELERVFKDQWREYRNQVPWMFVPGVI